MSKIGNEPKMEQKEKVHETSRPHTFRVALYIWSICVLGVASLCVLTINYPPRMTLAFAGFLLLDSRLRAMLVGTTGCLSLIVHRLILSCFGSSF